MVGSRFDKYIIQEEIGQGGMGTVYRAYHTGLNADVVLKVVSRSLIQQNSKFAQLFAQEAQTIAQLNHYAIVPVYDYGEHNGQPYIVMRLMEGGDLATRIETAPLSLQESNATMLRLADALDKAHGANIIHRDIKPSNVLYDDESLAYLADFGIAKLTQDTAPATTIGTWPYMAPEQWAGKAIDARTDVYQLGVTLFEMLTGKLPFDADSVAGWMYQHTQEAVPVVSAENPTLPLAINAVLNKALAKDPADRYPSVGAFAQAFSKLVKKASAPSTRMFGDEAPPSPPTPSKPVPLASTPPEKSTPAWLPLIGLLFLIGAMGIGYVLTRPEEPDGDPTTQVSTVFDPSPTKTLVVTPVPPTEIPPTLTPTPSPSPTLIDEILPPQLGDTKQSEQDGMVQHFVPAGTFIMGSTQDDIVAAFERACVQQPAPSPICDQSVYTAELEAHEIELDAYWIDETEVTNAMYQRCVADGECTPPATEFNENPSDPEKIINVDVSLYLSDEAFADHPVIGVDWDQSTQYCQWAGRQLPTEAQWEKAARGTEGDRIYPWGDEINCARANFLGCVNRPISVKSLTTGVSPFGAFDMAGNVWEWVDDWYSDSFYANSPATNPTGPATGKSKGVRGSSWSGLDIAVRSTNRGRVPPEFVMDNLGFRCAQPE